MKKLFLLILVCTLLTGCTVKVNNVVVRADLCDHMDSAIKESYLNSDGQVVARGYCYDCKGAVYFVDGVPQEDYKLVRKMIKDAKENPYSEPVPEIELEDDEEEFLEHNCLDTYSIVGDSYTDSEGKLVETGICHKCGTSLHFINGELIK